MARSPDDEHVSRSGSDRRMAVRTLIAGLRVTAEDKLLLAVVRPLPGPAPRFRRRGVLTSPP